MVIAWFALTEGIASIGNWNCWDDAVCTVSKTVDIAIIPPRGLPLSDVWLGYAFFYEIFASQADIDLIAPIKCRS